MPLYAYRCPACDLRAELFVSSSQRDAETLRCGECNTLNYAVVLRRELTAPALRGATVSRA